MEKRDHWLDYADDKYPRQLIEDTKTLMSLMVLFAPTIVFWALYEQQVKILTGDFQLDGWQRLERLTT